MAPISNAVLWDLIIQINVENTSLFQGDIPIVSGQVTDHAGKPISGVQLHIRSGQDSFFTTTDDSGLFKVELGGFNRIPGTYLVNVAGTGSDGKTGMATTEFQVRGDIEIYSVSEQLLSTEEAKKYLNSNQEDFANDSIGLRLYNYYQGILGKYLEEKRVADELTEEELRIEEDRIIAQQFRVSAIEEKNPGAGTYSGYKYEYFVENLDPTIKDIIINQLNYTTNTFAEAQQIMNDILSNGGTYEEARTAYLEKMSMPRALLETMTVNQTTTEHIISELNATQSVINSTSTNITNSTEPIETETVKTESLQTLMSMDNVQITTNGTSIFVNVNGTSIEFIINGTEITQVTNIQ